MPRHPRMHSIRNAANEFGSTNRRRSRTEVTGGATKGSFKLPGTDTSFTLSGYVKLDAVFSNPSIGADNSADLFLNPSSIPVGPTAGENQHNQVKFGARATRLSSRRILDTHVEFDFYDADGNESVSNSHGIRFRHAYATLGGGAVSVAGVVPVVGNDDFRFTASVGNGIGRYSDGFFPDAILDTDGRLQLPTQWGSFAAYRHFWTDRLRSLVLSMTGENNPSGTPATRTNRRDRCM